MTLFTKFSDRKNAGTLLAKVLLKYRDQNPLILGMPRGGVVVAAEVARALQAELDVVVVRKIGAPGNPEFAVGALAANNIVVWDESSVNYLNIDKPTRQQLQQEEQKELTRRLTLFRTPGKAPPIIENRVVIIVDDGLATGLSALAAIRSVKKNNPAKLILAVPVSSVDAASLCRTEVDELISLSYPEPFSAVGLWYQEFQQTSDAEVLELLRQAQTPS